MPLLSHYTSRLGLEGIAAARTFWATSFLELNDTSEFFFAWAALQKGAMELFAKSVPEGILPKIIDFDAMAATATTAMKDLFKTTGGKGHMYVTSFARTTTEDHERRGILTIWDRYTKHKGYCIQFEQGDIEQMIQLESWKGSYALIKLCEVQYGIDKTTTEYRNLCFQLAQQFILQGARTRPDIRFEPDFQKMWVESYLHQMLMDYCARHKDPCYEDEREVRIIAFPADRADARVFTGIASVKEIHRTTDGKSFIKLGEYWTPGIIPRRIIIGTKALKDIDSILVHYEGKPEVTHANMPIA